MSLRRSLHFFLLAVLPMFLMGCGTVRHWTSWRPHKKASKEEKKPPQDVLLGVVEMVNPEQKFVLIRSDIRMALQAGTKLQTRPKSGTKAELVLTPERKMSFISADIKEGFPQPGDMVIIPASEPAAAAVLSGGQPPATPAAGGAAGGGFVPAPSPDDPPVPGQLPGAGAGNAPVPGDGSGHSLPPPIR